MKLQAYYQNEVAKEKRRKKYTAITKVDSEKYVKHRTNDPQKFINSFILFKWPGARFINFFSNKGPDKRKLIYTWGKKKGLEPAK